MAIYEKKTLRAVGERLKQLREHLDYSRQKMGALLDLTANGYGKNENGETFLSIASLRGLSKDLNVSMDWLLFNRGSMFFPEQTAEEKEPVKMEEEKAPGIKDSMPDVRQLLDYMEQDSLFRHEVLVYFFKHKKENEPAPLAQTAQPVQSPGTGND